MSMDQISALIARAQAGEKGAREVLIENNLGLVRHIVKRFVGRGYDLEDLFQIGCIGLMKSIDKFDLQMGVKFSTYAVPLIMGEIKRFIRDDGPVKISRTIKENGYKIKTADRAFQMKQGREPTVEELAELTGLSMEELVLAMEANVPVESIYASIYQDDGSEVFLVDKVVEGKSGVGRSAGASPIDKEKEELLNHILLQQLLGELDAEDRELIRLRYFQNKTQTEVAGRLGISQVQVSRMEKRILLRMREKVT